MELLNPVPHNRLLWLIRNVEITKDGEAFHGTEAASIDSNADSKAGLRAPASKNAPWIAPSGTWISRRPSITNQSQRRPGEVSLMK